MTIKQRLKDGGTVIGGWCLSGSPVMAECLAISGFDFVVLDQEHGALSLPMMENCIARIQKQHKEAFVRVKSASDAGICLDMGATGIICPHIDSATDAAELRNACQYQERRSYCLGCCTDYGATFSGYTSWADEAVTIVGMIESWEGVQCLANSDGWGAALKGPPILGEGLDAILIGKYDLSASLGMPGDFFNMKYIKAVAKVVTVLNEAGAAYGYHDPNNYGKDGVQSNMTGARFICLGMDTTTLIGASRRILNGVR